MAKRIVWTSWVSGASSKRFPGKFFAPYKRDWNSSLWLIRLDRRPSRAIDRIAIHDLVRLGARRILCATNEGRFMSVVRFCREILCQVGGYAVRFASVTAADADPAANRSVHSVPAHASLDPHHHKTEASAPRPGRMPERFAERSARLNDWLRSLKKQGWHSQIDGNVR
jgi:hypothetical protein